MLSWSLFKWQNMTRREEMSLCYGDEELSLAYETRGYRSQLTFSVDPGNKAWSMVIGVLVVPRFLLCIEGGINLASQGMRSFYEVPKVLQACYLTFLRPSPFVVRKQYLMLQLSDTNGLLPQE